MGFGKFLHNATRAVGKTTHAIQHEATDIRRQAEHTVSSAASSAEHAAKEAGSHLAVAAGKTLASTTRDIGKVGIGKFNVANLSKTATHLGPGQFNLAGASNAVRDGISKVSHIPILGPILGVTTGIHLLDAVNNTLEGQRIDRAAIQGINKQIQDYKDAAPYIASVISFVPAVGPEVGAGISAGVALAEGKKWSDVAIEAAKGAIPGGAIAKAAFDIASSAAKGQKIDQIAIAALPIDDQAKQAIKTGLALTKDIMAGKRVDKALMARVGDAMKIAGPEIGKALNIGTAIGTARQLQDQIMGHMANPMVHDVLGKIGGEIANRVPALVQGRALGGDIYKKGFDVATGIMNGKKANEAMLDGLRNALPPEAKKGFDAATAFHVGKVLNSLKPDILKNPPAIPGVPSKKADPAQSFGYFLAHGLAGGADPAQKIALLQHVTQHPDMANGVNDAVRAVANQRAKMPNATGIPVENPSFWQNLIHFFTGTPPHLQK